MSRRDFELIIKEMILEIKNLTRDVFKIVSKNINSSKSISKVIDEAIKKTDFKNKIKQIYINSIPSIAKSLGGEVKSADLVGSYFEKSWLDDGLTLTKRISETTNQVSSEIKKTLIKSIKNNEDVIKRTSSLKKVLGKVDNGDINKRLLSISKLTKDDPRTQKEIDYFRKYLEGLGNQRKTQRSTRLRRSYERVLKAVESGNEERIQKALDNALDNKLRYRAEVIARTESSHAYTQMFNEKSLRDDDIVGYKWNVVSGHVTDQCDFFANQNIGLGAGVYKKGESPAGSPPVHPNCMCYLTPVYVGDIPEKALKKDYEIESGEKWLKRQPKKDQELIMGVGNREKWQNGRLDFKKAVKNYSEPEKIKKINPDIKKKIIF